MSVQAVIGELRARFQLAEGPSLVLGVATSDAVVEEVRTLVLEILRATPLALEDLGACGSSMGPARWAETTKAHARAEGYVLSFTPATQLESRAFAHLLNAERQLLQGLAGPVLLVVSRQTEAAIRTHAHDFFTWVARSYELPKLSALEQAAGTLGTGAAVARMPPEEPIRFLHVSDLHLRPGRITRYDQDRVLKGLVEFLRDDRPSAPLDLIFVSGDLAFSGKAEEYALVVELLGALLQTTGVPPELLFVVPGNHDVDRGIGKWLLRALESDEDAIAFFEDPSARAAHRRKLEAYEATLRPLLGETRSLGIGVGGDAVEVVEIRGTRLAVASFNSAWFSQGDSDQGKLWLGEPNVSRALDRIADEEAAFAIALVHHPFEYFHEIERSLVEHWFERGFDLVLRGHLHSTKTRSIASPRGGYVEVAAPAAYHGSQWPSGCFLGEIRAKARTVRLRPYEFAAGPDPWVLNAKAFPDDAEDGYCRTFEIPAKRRRKSGIAEISRMAAKSAYENATPQQQREVQRSVLSKSATSKQQADHETVLRLMEEPEMALHDLLGKKSPDVALVSAIERAVAVAPQPPIDVTDMEGFERALVRAGRLFLEHTAALGMQRSRLTESATVLGFAAALSSVVDAAIAVRPMLGANEPDIVIGRIGGTGPYDLIEVTHGRSSVAKLRHNLARVDRYLQSAPGRYCALVWLGLQPPGAEQPHIEHRKTPSGHEVLILHL